MAPSISALRCVRPTSYALILACLAGCGAAIAQTVAAPEAAVVATDPTWTALATSGGPWALMLAVMLKVLPIVDRAGDLAKRAVETAERVSTDGLHIHHHVDTDGDG